MKNRSTLFVFLLAFLLTSFTSCSIIGDIFQAGMWVGIVIVIVVVLLIVFLISKIRKKS